MTTVRLPSIRPRRPAVRRDATRGGPLAVRLVVEAVLFVGAALVYFAVRGLTEGGAAPARANAEWLVDAERAMGILWEPAIQDLVVDHHALVTVANWVYIWGHWPLIGAVAVWLFITRPGDYRLMRNAIFAAGAIGLVIFALLPVMPPRMGVIDVADTVSLHSTAYRALQPPAFVNQYAAFPSLHVGFNLLVAIALFRSTRRPWLRGLAIAIPLAMSAAVVLTANHYLIDIPAGAAVALAGYAIALRMPDGRLSPPPPRRPANRRRPERLDPSTP